jgi:hypothetical protein
VYDPLNTYPDNSKDNQASKLDRLRGNLDSRTPGNSRMPDGNSNNQRLPATRSPPPAQRAPSQGQIPRPPGWRPEPPAPKRKIQYSDSGSSDSYTSRPAPRPKLNESFTGLDEKMDAKKASDMIAARLPNYKQLEQNHRRDHQTKAMTDLGSKFSGRMNISPGKGSGGSNFVTNRGTRPIDNMYRDNRDRSANQSSKITPNKAPARHAGQLPPPPREAEIRRNLAAREAQANAPRKRILDRNLDDRVGLKMDRLKNTLQGPPPSRRQAPAPYVRPDQDFPQRPPQNPQRLPASGPKGPAPKPQKKLKASEDPNNIYCARCAMHHHRDLHTGGKKTSLATAPQSRNQNQRKQSDQYDPFGGTNIRSNTRNTNRDDQRDMLDQVLGKRDAPDNYDGYDSESEEGYDEDSDFIDDGDDPEDSGYQHELRRITGYDPSKYDIREEMMEDDRNMEVRDFGMLQMEEYVSRRRGREDDEREDRIAEKMKHR